MLSLHFLPVLVYDHSLKLLPLEDFCPNSLSYIYELLQKCELWTFSFQLVYEAILSSARELGTLEDEEGNEVIDIPLVHVAYSMVQLRLSCFAKLVQAHPDLVPRLRELSREKESEVVSCCNISEKKIFFPNCPSANPMLITLARRLHDQIFWIGVLKIQA